jgi:hypothetical protein
MKAISSKEKLKRTSPHPTSHESSHPKGTSLDPVSLPLGSSYKNLKVYNFTK